MIAATEEERFTRIKHWAGFPKLAIKFCLKEAGVSINDLDYITIGRDPNAKVKTKIKFLLSNPLLGLSILKNRIDNRKQLTSLNEELFAIDHSSSASEIDKKLKFVEHHRSHLASAFFASPFNDAAIISIDGSGDFTTTMIAMAK